MATNTYTALKTNTVTGSSVASVTFDLTGITGYTDLVIVINSKNTTNAAACKIQFNGDSGSNYSTTWVEGVNTSPSSGRNSNDTAGFVYYNGGASTNNWSTAIVNIQNYSNSSTYKTVITRFGNIAQTGVYCNLWRSTSAITSITLNAITENFQIGSTFNLYGIANADNFNKANGGVIVEDSTYMYHVFGGSGTFTPKQSLTADVLIIGGGGGGNGRGGGGGAGGLLYLSNQSLTTTNYTVTVGGGSAGSNSSSDSAKGTDSSFGASTAIGGGGGLISVYYSTADGGSGGGGGSHVGTTTGGSGTSGQGNAGGGNAGYTSNPYPAGGGGGAGAAGGNATGPSTPGIGGVGLSTYSSWGLATNTGHNISGTVYYSGGGAGGGYAAQNSVSGGYGGGGATGGNAGLANTGGGGGGWWGSTGGNGGSGLVIVRYVK